MIKKSDYTKILLHCYCASASELINRDCIRLLRTHFLRAQQANGLLESLLSGYQPFTTPLLNKALALASTSPV